MIEALFPPGVVVVRATPDMAAVPLYPEEVECTAGMSASRLREFTLGRACARVALARLGCEGPVLREERTPRWPEGVVGSLTHCDGFCAVAVARSSRIRSIGIDAEFDTALSERAADRICNVEERDHLGTLPPLCSGDWPKLVFSAKEAFYKAYFPVARSFLGFKDVALRFDAEARSFQARLLRDDKPGPRLATGRYALMAPHVFTAVTLLRDGDAA